MSTASRSVLRRTGLAAAVALAYYASARAGLSLAFAAEQVTLVWPPTGIALAALLAFGAPSLAGIWAGAFAANFALGEPLGAAVAIATGNTLQPMAAVWLLRRAGFDARLERLRDVLALLALGAAVAPAVSATVGATTLCAAGLHPWGAFAALWRRWWLGDGMGVLIAGPVLLTWATGRHHHRPPSVARRIEMAALFAGLAAVAVLIFIGQPGPTGPGPHLLYAVFPFLIWPAVRFGQRETASALLLVEALAVTGAVSGRAPFAGTVDERLILLQLFMAVVASTALVLGAAIAESRTAERRRAADFKVTQALHESPDLDTAAARIVGGIRESLGWDVGALWLVDSPADVLRCLHVEHDARLLGSRFVAATRERTFAHGIGLPGRVWASGAPAWISDAVRDPNFPRAAAAAEQGMHAAVGFPIRLGGEVLGVIEFFSRDIRPPDEDLLRMFATIGAQIGQFIDRVRAEADRGRLLSELRSALQAKDEFLAVLGHELRNPLAPLRNAAEILALRGAGDPALARIQAIIERQVRHMVRLVDDLLDVSRIARGRVELRRERVALADVVSRAADAVRTLVEERGQGLAVHAGGNEVLVDGDPVRLEQVVSNLLHNAARYTPPGGHLEVGVAAEGDRAVVRVRDDGIGIAPEMVERIFELFVQGDRPRDGAGGGLGIGLTVVRNLVQLHGGTVSARSEGRGRGTEFEVRLPLARTAAPAAAPKSVPPTGLARPRRVLVVDDNRDAAESLALVLRDAGHDVVTAADGAAALTVSGAQPFDVVFLDLAMPDGLDGFEVAARMRADPRLHGVKLVALTGFGQQEDRRRTSAAGFDAHLVKPVDPDDVRRLLASVPAAAVP
jgi:signal transduction histidine kinase/ActR/RegA family two-component response regulator